MNKSRTSHRWMSVAAASLLAIALAGCNSGGGGGGDTTGAPPPAGGSNAPSVAVPSGTSPVTITSATPAATFATLAPVVTVGGVSISSPPQVSFSIADANNNPIIGFGSTSKISTATVASYPNLSFALAKLVPGTNGAPSKWVSYIVTSVPTTTAAATGQRPGTDNTGTLVDNKNGTYTYTFYRDITKVKDQVAALALTAPNVAADLGDLTYDPSLVHRLTIAISGNAPGTGTNTPNAVQLTDALPMANPVNVIYDFIPATGKPATAADMRRELVVTANCNECHGKLGNIPGSAQAFHGGARYDPNYCVVCHTDQRKYGRTNSTSTASVFPALTKTVNATTGAVSYSPSTYVADGVTVGDFPVLIHKIHNGKELVKTNYNYANVLFSDIGYSMLGGGQKMCSKCHKNAAQAENWNAVPTRLACGACHDGINWATGKGSTLADKAAATAVGAVLATSGHVGGAQSGDATCALCHNAASIKTYHMTENVTPHNPTVEAGLKNFTYEIDSASVNSTTNVVTVKFKISADGAPVTFVPAAATVTNPLSGFTGGPSFLLPYAMSQDGVTTPVDYNNLGRTNAQPASVSIANLLSTGKAATVGTLSGPDASGYYTANIVAGSGFPAGAKMRAVALQGYFTQVSPAAARHTISVVKAVTGDAVRRTVVDKEKCANCHEWFEGHGGNRVKETQVCVACHNPGISSSGRGISDAALAAYAFSAADVQIFTGWGFDKTMVNAALNFPVTTNNFKDMIHGIHAGKERTTPFVDARDRTPSAITLLDMSKLGFPGILRKCETCHVAGTYSSAPANALASTYEANNGAVATPADVKLSLASTPNASDRVTTPFTAACVSCHDSAPAQAHMKLNGGQILVNRSTLSLNGESCAVCHGAGRDQDPAAVHK